MPSASTLKQPLASSPPEKVKKNESETSKHEESDDDRGPGRYVPETDTEDEPIHSLGNSKCLGTEESLMVNMMDLDIIGGTNGKSANEKLTNETTGRGQSTNEQSTNRTSDTVHSTTVAGGGQNFCFVCKQAHFKIARHFKTHLKDNADIAKALSLPVGSRSRKELLEKLRNKGNFIHNNEVLKKGSGSLKVKRRTKGEFNYEYCIYCMGMFLRPELWRHMKRCSSNPKDNHGHREPRIQGRKRVLGLASVVKSVTQSTSQWTS